jgi:hypothetical protein
MVQLVHGQALKAPHGLNGRAKIHARRLKGFAQGRIVGVSRVLCRLHVTVGEPPLVSLKTLCGIDDDWSPCLVILLSDED